MPSLTWTAAIAVLMILILPISARSAADSNSGMSAAAYQDWMKRELKDWKNPTTGSTLIGGFQCDTTLEYRLVGTSHRNAVLIGLTNSADATRELKPFEVKITFPGGKVRESAYRDQSGNLLLQKSSKLFAAIFFSEKSDLDDQDSFSIQIPLRNENGDVVCVVDSKLVRPSVSHDPETGLNRSSLIYSFEFGLPLAKSGDLRAIGDNGLRFDLVMYGYFGLHHGAIFGMAFQGYPGPNPGLLGTVLMLGYSYRAFVSSRVTLNYDFAPGIHEFSLDQSGQDLKRTDYSLSLTQRVGIDYLFARSSTSLFDLEHSVGVTLAHDWLPRAALETVPAGGQSISFLVRYKLGL